MRVLLNHPTDFPEDQMSSIRNIARKQIGTAAAVAAAALMVAPASSLASTSFPYHLTPDTEPSNSVPGLDCQPTVGMKCTFVQEVARYQPAVGAGAPRNGTLKRIRLIAGAAGQFRLQIVRLKPDPMKPGQLKAKLITSGPAFNYQGQTQSNWDNGVYSIESFPVNIKIKKGDHLAIKATSTSMVYCAGGGNDTLMYQPALSLGNPFAPQSGADGCNLLLEGVLR
jgi:hypothetical protein